MGGALGVLAVVALGGCPGSLDGKDRFLVDGQFVWGDLAVAPPGAEAGVGPGDGGSDGGGIDSGPMDPCGDVPGRVFATSCGGNGCHGVSAPQNGLDLESPEVAGRVVGKTSMVCNVVLADPRNPNGSLLFLKLLPQPPCGAQMPLARPPLSNFDIACVRAWIAAQ